MNKPFITDLPILLIDDEEIILKAMTRAFNLTGITNIITVSDSREVLSTMAKHDIAFVLLDLAMPHLTGDALLEMIIQNHPQVPVIMVTANDDVSTIVSCIKKGALDYIVKPVDTGRLLAAARGAVEVRELRSENAILQKRKQKKGLKNPEAFDELLTRSEEMESIFQYLEAIANSSQPFVITGETGVGKDLLAKAIHRLSKRKGEFVAVNVAGLDDNIFADTLFGHIKGAYTGAERDRGGQIKKAAGGTLFLDEIGDLSMASQVKLLRLIQEREYTPIGSDKPEFTDTRIVAASNRNLDELKETGEFRKDLYFRICAHQVYVPPLRERLEDLPLLVEHFLKKAALEFDKKKPTVPDEIYVLLNTYHFPGNIRELRSLIYDAVSKHTSGVMSLDSFRKAVGGGKSVPASKSDSQSMLTFGSQLPSMKEIRRLLVDEAMRRADNNRTVAAQLIGITRQSLSQYLQSDKT
ncbi:sigma-54 dependent transcriptional regulator [bacterium]|nr:sigma-54 dependent transcriptional regulator [bacterium]